MFTLIQCLEDVAKFNICTGCGNCVGSCRIEGAISMIVNERGEYEPRRCWEHCVDCGLCLTVCPEITTVVGKPQSKTRVFLAKSDFSRLTREVFGPSAPDVLLGHYRKLYVGHAMAPDIRYQAASGGIITALLSWGLESGLVTGVVSVRMSASNPLVPEVFIARNVVEVLEASGSKYCPVPLNQIIKDIPKHEGRLAVVGLPCHMRAFRKAEEQNKKLQSKIALHIGLFCFHTVTFEGTRVLLRRAGIAPERVAKITYRGNGWPGGVQIELEDGQRQLIPHHSAWGELFSFLFIPMACTMCADSTNELSDISVGDAWLPEFKDAHNPGESLIITRTKLGHQLVQQASVSSIITLNAIERIEVLKAQSVAILFKKNLHARQQLLSALGQSVPEIDEQYLKPRLIVYLNAILLYLGMLGLSMKLVKELVVRLPSKLIYLWGIACYLTLAYQRSASARARALARSVGIEKVEANN